AMVERLAHAQQVASVEARVLVEQVDATAVDRDELDGPRGDQLEQRLQVAVVGDRVGDLAERRQRRLDSCAVTRFRRRVRRSRTPGRGLCSHLSSDPYRTTTFRGV